MAGCVLRVSGTTFQPDTFLAGAVLTPCKVWRRGDPDRNTRPARATSGFNVTVSGADDLPAQVKEALRFLEEHRADLLELSVMPEVDDLALDFGIPQRNVSGQFDEFPAPLVRAGGELRMSFVLSQYATDADGS